MKVGIIAAMPEEAEELLNNFEIIGKISMPSGIYYMCNHKGLDLVMTVSGIGKVNAAIAAQILITKFNVKCILNTGIAGGIDDKLNIGDVVLSSDAIEYDVDITHLGYKQGCIPQMDTSIFKASEKLLNIAQNITRKIELNNTNIYIGRIISGDRFLADNDMKLKLKSMFDALCVEMEGAAIAHTCYLNKIDFLIIRSISDLANGNASEDYDAFYKQAIINSSKLVIEILATWQTL